MTVCLAVCAYNLLSAVKTVDRVFESIWKTNICQLDKMNSYTEIYDPYLDPLEEPIGILAECSSVDEDFSHEVSFMLNHKIFLNNCGVYKGE